jgi:hypothetical protein
MLLQPSTLWTASVGRVFILCNLAPLLIAKRGHRLGNQGVPVLLVLYLCFIYTVDAHLVCL